MDIFKLGDKILDLLNAIFAFWNNQIALVFELLGQSPTAFKGGGPWGIIEGIEPVFVAVGSSLVVLFFVIGFCSESIDIREEMRFEVILRILIRLGLAEYANIGNVSDVGYVLENDAEGIGLFRSEFLYLGKADFPTEEEQFQVYKQVVQVMAGKRVIIRTLDIGADKQAEYFNLGKEDNPALGYRAIRICLKQPEIFKTQLRALLRAAVFGNLSIMYPMITSTEEVGKIYEIVEEVEQELKQAQIPYKIPEQGIMIETPAAVMVSDELAEMVDFFSIGTNDLTQYTLAIDRQNEKLDDFYNPHHKAIIKMIQIVTDNAHKHGKWAGICGELGADLDMTECFVRIGVDELSVSPSMVLQVRQQVRQIGVAKK